jgi:hypothetical protein
VKSLILNKKSWHYWIATEFGGLYRWHNSTDICEYTKSIFIGFCVMALAAGAFLFFSELVVNLVLCSVFSLIAGSWLGGHWAELALVLIAAAAGTAVVMFGLVAATAGKEIVQDALSNSQFVKAAYDSWKNKFCARVEFKD